MIKTINFSLCDLILEEIILSLSLNQQQTDDRLFTLCKDKFPNITYYYFIQHLEVLQRMSFIKLKLPRIYLCN